MKKLFSRFKKGVSIVEVVIAIAVISIISVAAVTTLTYSIKAQNKNLRDFDVATTCNTVIDCFRFADENSEETNFISLLKTATILKETDSVEENVIKIDRIKYELEIKTSESTIELTAFDNSGNEIHETISYTK